MSGDERARFCAQCSKRVYNFSVMTGAEVTALVQETEGKLCGRFYRRSDGTMLTADCPIGLTARASRRMKSLVFAALLAVAGGLGATAYAKSVAARRQQSQQPGRVAMEFDRLVWKVKGLFGLRPPMMLMGDVCLPPSQSATTPLPVPANK